MPLIAGAKLGPYEVLSSLGAGGMGEVYKARDTRLDRTVAIKVLASHLSANPDLRQRFDREARAISSLNHPHICTLYDVGHQDGTDFLIMEYLEGESLAERLRAGPLSLHQLLQIGVEIAAGLDRAHREGIVHRDLKPGNIMLTKSGAKLLDFGLAKPLSAIAGANNGTNAPLLSAAMTLTSPSPAHSPLTSAGMIVGTVQYMSPEQIEGREADARSDIFALGAVLYEMATGKRAFEGKSQLSVASAILEKDPEPISAARPLTPPAFEYLVQTCLAKNPDERFQSAHDVELQLQWVSKTPAASAPVASKSKTNARWSWIAVLAASLLAIAFALSFLFNSRPRATVVHSSIVPPEKIVLDVMGDNAGPPAISADGTRIVFAAHVPGSPQVLWLRRLDSPVATRIEGTEDGQWPFFSPDGAYIAFFSHGNLNKVLGSGGPVVALSPAEQPRGGSWGANDIILYAPSFQGPIYSINANGGRPAPVTRIDRARHTTHRWPVLLPDGKHFLFYATNHAGGAKSENGIYFGALGEDVARLVLPSEAAAEFGSGYLLYHAQSALVAQAFDPASGTLSGQPAPVVDHVLNDLGTWHTLFSVSANGTLLYEPGASAGNEFRLVWYDRGGKVLGTAADHGSYQNPRISPDGKRVAVIEGAASGDVFVIDAQRAVKTRLTFNTGNVNSAAWSPDGKMLVYDSSVAGTIYGDAIKMRPANGSGVEQIVAQEAATLLLPSFSPDGKLLLYLRQTSGSGSSVFARPISGAGEPFRVVAPASAQSNINNYRVSPDGHWIAYASDESGSNQIYVAPFPSGSGKWQVSSADAAMPLWRSDGKELFFLSNSDGSVNAAGVSATGGEFAISGIKPLFKLANTAATGTVMDVSPDGQRFLVNTSPEQTAVPFNLVQNWTAELKK